MRISNAIRLGSVATAILIAAPALAFDNQQTPAAASVPVAPLAPAPGVLGARTWNVKVAFAPGATDDSVCTAGRVVYGHATDRPAHIS